MFYDQKLWAIELEELKEMDGASLESDHESDCSDDTADKSDEGKLKDKTRKFHRKTRLKVHRKVVRESWRGEPAEVQETVTAEWERLKVEFATERERQLDERNDLKVERTSEHYKSE
jgi:hypothetical protein